MRIDLDIFKKNPLKMSNVNLKAILGSMASGIIALDNSNTIIYMNSSAEKTLFTKGEQLENKDFFKNTKESILNESIKELIKNNEIDSMEVEVNHPLTKVLKIYKNKITDENNSSIKIGTLIMLEDITDVRKLETIRKDFVANVSHELRTPLTSINGFLETLKSGAVSDEYLRNKFLNIIYEETYRLNNLIEDLSILTDIENRQSEIIKERINPNETILEVIEILTELADSKKITIINNSKEKLPLISGNEGWLKQMLINLIENSIKYTDKKGKIEVISYSTSNHIILKVKDNGIGIDTEYIDRIFERFFRVDKSRTKKTAGTGLGLAIVKHIVIQFNGNIEVFSEKGKGTEFEITLPI